MATVISDETRREVVHRLREHSGANLFTGDDVERLIGAEPSGFRPEDADKNYNRLADLIEPKPERTCQIVSAFDTDELDDIQECISSSPEDTLAYKCKGCGFDFRYERGLYPNYCPNCGAKKVVRDGK